MSRCPALRASDSADPLGQTPSCPVGAQALPPALCTPSRCLLNPRSLYLGLGGGGRGEAGFSAGQPHPRSRGDSAGPLASHTRFSRSPLPTQVWFKNRRAQRSRLERRQAQGGCWRAGDAPTDPGVPWTPAPAPESAAAAGSPSYSGCPGFYSRPPPPSPAGVLPAPEHGVSSHHPATWGPAQGVHVYGPAAPTPAPAPGWPQDRKSVV